MSDAPAGHSGNLERVLGVPALFATAYGDVGSSIYYALGLVAASALGLTPLVFLISGVIFAFTAMTYAEGTASFPEAGGASSFARHAFNEFASFAAAWAQTLNYLLTIAISAFFVPHYLSAFWEPLSGHHGSHWDVVGGIVAIILLAMINVFGAKETTSLNVVLAGLAYITQVILVIIGAVLIFHPHILATNVHWGVAPKWKDFFTAIAIAMIAFTGMETISNLAEETRDPARSVPRAMMYVVLAAMAIYATLPAVTLMAFPVHLVHGTYQTDLGTKWAANPILGLATKLPIHVAFIKSGLEKIVSLLAAALLLTATNAGIIGVSRLTYSMGQHRQLPDVMRKLHPKYGTPFVAILGYASLSCLLLLPGLANPHASTDEANLLGNLYAFGAMLSFSIAHIAIIGLRLKRTEMQWQAPLNLRVRGTSLPLFAIFGLFGTGFAWLIQLLLHPTERWLGLAWLVIGLVGYVFYRRAQGLPLTQTVRAAVLIPERKPTVDYRSVLVPILGQFDVAAFSAATRIATESRSVVYVLAPLEVPLSLPLNAELPDRARALDAELDRAAALGAQLGVRVVTRIQRTRNVVQTILEEAELREAQIVVVGSEGAASRHHRLRLVSSSVEKIVRKAPSRVLLIASRNDRAWSHA